VVGGRSGEDADLYIWIVADDMPTAVAKDAVAQEIRRLPLATGEELTVYAGEYRAKAFRRPQLVPLA